MLIYNSKGVPKRHDLDQMEYPFNQRYSRIRFKLYYDFLFITSLFTCIEITKSFFSAFLNQTQIRFVLNLSHQIQARSGSQSRLVKDEDAFHKTFPHFIWLLRDVMTDIPDDCKDIKEYFLTRVRMVCPGF